jgi:chemotaxis protein histidine kinase CheA
MRDIMKFITRIFIILLTFILISTSCGKEEEKKSSDEISKQEDKLPKELEEIEKGIDDINKDLKGPTEEEDKSPNNEEDNKEEQQSKEGEQNKENQQESQNEQKDTENSSISNQQGEQEQKKEESEEQKQKETWDKVKTAVDELHYKWNKYKPMAIKKGIDNKVVEGFGTTLNNLTNVLQQRNQMDTLTEINKLYSFIPDFYALYKTDVPAEIKRIKYYVRNIMLNAIIENWIQTEADIKELKTVWSIYKGSMKEEQKDISDLMSLSIVDIEKVVLEKDKVLVGIKGKVCLLNIKELEDVIKKEKSQS